MVHAWLCGRISLCMVYTKAFGTFSYLGSLQVEPGSGSFVLCEFWVHRAVHFSLRLWLWFMALFGRAFGAFMGL
jgi:hypothetical protein